MSIAADAKIAQEFFNKIKDVSKIEEIIPFLETFILEYSERLIKEQMEQSKVYELFAYTPEPDRNELFHNLKSETVHPEFIIVALRFIKILMRLAKYKDFPEHIDRVYLYRLLCSENEDIILEFIQILIYARDKESDSNVYSTHFLSTCLDAFVGSRDEPLFQPPLISLLPSVNLSSPISSNNSTTTTPFSPSTSTNAVTHAFATTSHNSNTVEVLIGNQTKQFTVQDQNLIDLFIKICHEREQETHQQFEDSEAVLYWKVRLWTRIRKLSAANEANQIKWKQIRMRAYQINVLFGSETIYFFKEIVESMNRLEDLAFIDYCKNFIPDIISTFKCYISQSYEPAEDLVCVSDETTDVSSFLKPCLKLVQKAISKERSNDQIKQDEQLFEAFASLVYWLGVKCHDKLQDSNFVESLCIILESQKKGRELLYYLVLRAISNTFVDSDDFHWPIPIIENCIRILCELLQELDTQNEKSSFLRLMQQDYNTQLALIVIEILSDAIDDGNVSSETATKILESNLLQVMKYFLDYANDISSKLFTDCINVMSRLISFQPASVIKFINSGVFAATLNLTTSEIWEQLQQSQLKDVVILVGAFLIQDSCFQEIVSKQVYTNLCKRFIYCSENDDHISTFASEITSYMVRESVTETSISSFMKIIEDLIIELKPNQYFGEEADENIKKLYYRYATACQLLKEMIVYNRRLCTTVLNNGGLDLIFELAKICFVSSNDELYTRSQTSWFLEIFESVFQIDETLYSEIIFEKLKKELEVVRNIDPLWHQQRETLLLWFHTSVLCKSIILAVPPKWNLPQYETVINNLMPMELQIRKMAAWNLCLHNMTENIEKFPQIKRQILNFRQDPYKFVSKNTVVLLSGIMENLGTIYTHFRDTVANKNYFATLIVNNIKYILSESKNIIRDEQLENNLEVICLFMQMNIVKIFNIVYKYGRLHELVLKGLKENDCIVMWMDLVQLILHQINECLCSEELQQRWKETIQFYCQDSVGEFRESQSVFYSFFVFDQFLNDNLQFCLKLLSNDMKIDEARDVKEHIDTAYYMKFLHCQIGHLVTEICEKIELFSFSASLHMVLVNIAGYLIKSKLPAASNTTSTEKKKEFVINNEALTQLLEMGFGLLQSKTALKETNNDLASATEWCLNNPMSEEADKDDIELEDGEDAKKVEQSEEERKKAEEEAEIRKKIEEKEIGNFETVKPKILEVLPRIINHAFDSIPIQTSDKKIIFEIGMDLGVGASMKTILLQKISELSLNMEINSQNEKFLSSVASMLDLLKKKEPQLKSEIRQSQLGKVLIKLYAKFNTEELCAKEIYDITLSLLESLTESFVGLKAPEYNNLEDFVAYLKESFLSDEDLHALFDFLAQRIENLKEEVVTIVHNQFQLLSNLLNFKPLRDSFKSKFMSVQKFVQILMSLPSNYCFSKFFRKIYDVLRPLTEDETTLCFSIERDACLKAAKNQKLENLLNSITKYHYIAHPEHLFQFIETAYQKIDSYEWDRFASSHTSSRKGQSFEGIENLIKLLLDVVFKTLDFPPKDNERIVVGKLERRPCLETYHILKMIADLCHFFHYQDLVLAHTVNERPFIDFLILDWMPFVAHHTIISEHNTSNTCAINTDYTIIWQMDMSKISMFLFVALLSQKRGILKNLTDALRQSTKIGAMMAYVELLNDVIEKQGKHVIKDVVECGVVEALMETIPKLDARIPHERELSEVILDLLREIVSLSKDVDASSNERREITLNSFSDMYHDCEISHKIHDDALEEVLTKKKKQEEELIKPTELSQENSSKQSEVTANENSASENLSSNESLTADVDEVAEIEIPKREEKYVKEFTMISSFDYYDSFSHYSPRNTIHNEMVALLKKLFRNKWRGAKVKPPRRKLKLAKTNEENNSTPSYDLDVDIGQFLFGEVAEETKSSSVEIDAFINSLFDPIIEEDKKTIANQEKGDESPESGIAFIFNEQPAGASQESSNSSAEKHDDSILISLEALPEEERRAILEFQVTELIPSRYVSIAKELIEKILSLPLNEVLGLIQDKTMLNSKLDLLSKEILGEEEVFNGGLFDEPMADAFKDENVLQIKQGEQKDREKEEEGKPVIEYNIAKVGVIDVNKLVKYFFLPKDLNSTIDTQEELLGLLKLLSSNKTTALNILHIFVTIIRCSFNSAKISEEDFKLLFSNEFFQYNTMQINPKIPQETEQLAFKLLKQFLHSRLYQKLAQENTFFNDKLHVLQIIMEYIESDKDEVFLNSALDVVYVILRFFEKRYNDLIQKISAIEEEKKRREKKKLSEEKKRNKAVKVNEIIESQPEAKVEKNFEAMSEDEILQFALQESLKFADIEFNENNIDSANQGMEPIEEQVNTNIEVPVTPDTNNNSNTDNENEITSPVEEDERTNESTDEDNIEVDDDEVGDDEEPNQSELGGEEDEEENKEDEEDLFEKDRDMDIETDEIESSIEDDIIDEDVSDSDLEIKMQFYSEEKQKLISFIKDLLQDKIISCLIDKLINTSSNIMTKKLSCILKKVALVVESKVVNRMCTIVRKESQYISNNLNQLRKYLLDHQNEHINSLPAEWLSRIRDIGSERRFCKALSVYSSIVKPNSLYGRKDGSTKQFGVAEINSQESVELLNEHSIDSLWESVGRYIKLVVAQHDEDWKHLEHTPRLILLVQGFCVFYGLFMESSNNNEPHQVSDMKATPTPTSFSPLSKVELFMENNKKLINGLLKIHPPLFKSTLSMVLRYPEYIDFENKKSYFYANLLKRKNHENTLYMSFERQKVFEESVKILLDSTAKQLKNPLDITFEGEHAIDHGGVSREWFAVMCREFFNSNLGLFIHTINQSTFQPNPLSKALQDHLKIFQACGRFIAMAVYHKQLLDCYFTRSFYKHMLGIPLSYKDMEGTDPEFYNNLKWVYENDIESMELDLCFTIEVEDMESKRKVVELKPDGAHIKVTNENKAEYVRLVTEFKMTKSIQDQLESFLKGFFEIISKELLSIFNEQELELLISGLPEIDIEDMKRNTEYSGYTAMSPQIRWFWNTVEHMTEEEKAQLLQFVTGTSKVPLDGFKALIGSGSIQKFNISKVTEATKLPSSHTCFNQLDLPEYSSEEELKEKLLIAVKYSYFGFGFA